MDSVTALYKDLKTEWDKSAPNLRKCGSLLDQLKVALTKLVFLPTGESGVSKKELLVARDVLEIAVQFSVATKDVTAFERYMAQLKCYYFDYKTEIGESANKYQLLGLNLLFLLSQNRVSEFHTELELLPQEIIQTNEFIRHPLAMEQYFMEGSYNKIFRAKGQVPSQSYNVFMDLLVDTVRDEIGACLESSYDKISTKELQKRLNFKNEKEVISFGKKRNWVLGAGNVYSFASLTHKPKEPLPSVELVEQAIFYARELEMIV
ncbi:26S proteasome non-ATPase regulatory subunit 8 [Sitodiplosis mosellana]|uniref:26S proteasome non-ATPase regulatory subunit 8 n=1 Tax=Sitodiplosis mosellana TaxID=263140 RepID=UPI0024445B60|nr:26S proteasome non-ATPase regulatory subunit 8 [Sitodiplosis mosellana]